jgi:tRNA G18 (ribose-2'-O)-methylase SpoU
MVEHCFVQLRKFKKLTTRRSAVFSFLGSHEKCTPPITGTTVRVETGAFMATPLIDCRKAQLLVIRKKRVSMYKME